MTTQENTQAESTEDKTQLSVEYYFPTAIYSVMKPEYLQKAQEVCAEYVEKAKLKNTQLDELYPVYQTENFPNDPKIKELSDYILNVSWDILDSQGYDMSNMRTYFDEFWCQDHSKHSGMDQHIHGFGTQIVGFYFTDCPENSSKILFYDPKPAKIQIGLKEVNSNIATPASNIINFQPKPGLLILTNSWLAHSFTRSGAAESMRFIHFTVYPNSVPQICQTTMPEII